MLYTKGPSRVPTTHDKVTTEMIGVLQHFIQELTTAVEHLMTSQRRRFPPQRSRNQAGQAIYYSCGRLCHIMCQCEARQQPQPETTRIRREMSECGSWSLTCAKTRDAVYATYHESQMLTMPAIIAGHHVEMIVDTGAAVNTVPPNFTSGWEEGLKRLQRLYAVSMVTW